MTTTTPIRTPVSAPQDTTASSTPKPQPSGPADRVSAAAGPNKYLGNARSPRELALAPAPLPEPKPLAFGEKVAFFFRRRGMFLRPIDRENLQLIQRRVNPNLRASDLRRLSVTGDDRSLSIHRGAFANIVAMMFGAS